MRVLIVAVNSQFIHASPVPWLLKAACRRLEVDINVLECSINDRFERIVGDILLARPEVLALSCYIWNIEYVLRLVADVKKLLPDISIVLGGPEAASREDLGEYVEILLGDGELSFHNYIAEKVGGKKITGDPFLEDSQLYKIAATDICKHGKGRIVYIETIRGCPFRCAYCLAPTAGRVRKLPLDLVHELIDIYMDSQVRQVKFVDRTFNVDSERAYEIIRYIKEAHAARNNPPASWHFEVAADLFDERLLTLIEGLPRGLVQFEIGVQSLNQEVLEVSTRKTNTEKVLDNIEALISMENCHIHADLIAGLPGEDLSSFQKGFDLLHSKKPHQLQLGFLKVLHGTPMRDMPLIWSDIPPYRVLQSDALSWEELKELEYIEEVLERVWNNRRFQSTVELLANKNYFKFYQSLARYLIYKNKLERPLSPTGMAEQLFNRCKEFSDMDEEEIRVSIITDLILSCYPVRVPQVLKVKGYSKDLYIEALKFAKEKFGSVRRHVEPLSYSRFLVVNAEKRDPVSGQLEHYIFE